MLKKNAFTLAEVLITLGIIGLVAAMTIPVLIKNYQEFQYKQSAKKVFSVASQAIAQMKEDNGGDLLNYVETTGSFVLEFEKYFKSPRDCSPARCVAGANPSSVYKNFLNGNARTRYMDDGQFETGDGMFWGIENLSSSGWIGLTVDVNGYKIKPNKFGVDTFMFQIIDNALSPMGAPNTFFPASAYCTNSDNTYQGLGCMYYIIQGMDY